MNKKDVSFIIPVYNTKIDILIRCLKSIKKQRLIDFEIIIINDGSTSIKNEVYRKIARKYNAKYFYQKKQGVSVARNKGIEESIGKYIFFVDSDDELVENSVNKADFKDNIDFLIYNVKKINQNLKSEKVFYLENKSLSQYFILTNFLKNDLLNWSVGKLYKRSFIIEKNISFDINRSSGEDFEFVYSVYSAKPIIKYISKVVYVYLYNDVTGNERIISDPIRNIKDIINLYEIRNKIISQAKELNSYKVYLCQNTINDLFNNYSIVITNDKNIIKKIRPLYIKAVDHFDKSALKQIGQKYKIKLFLIKHNLYYLTKIYNKLFSLKVNIKKEMIDRV